MFNVLQERRKRFWKLKNLEEHQSWCTWRKRACEEHLAGTRSMAAVPVVGEQLEETMERARGKTKIELEPFCLGLRFSR